MNGQQNIIHKPKGRHKALTDLAWRSLDMVIQQQNMAVSKTCFSFMTHRAMKVLDPQDLTWMKLNARSAGA